jgi:hypothetical protein
MKYILSTLFALAITFTAMAQSGNAQREIDEQVWKPFIESFNQNNTDKFMSVHSKDVMRVTQDDKKIINWNEYNSSMRSGDERDKQNNRKRSIELRFINRIASADRAFDVGYYKTTYHLAGGDRSYYGKFHVALRKENGTWKILLDTDTAKDVTAEHFNAAPPMQ